MDIILYRPTGITKLLGLKLGVQVSYNVRLKETLPVYFKKTAVLVLLE